MAKCLYRNCSENAQDGSVYCSRDCMRYDYRERFNACPRISEAYSLVKAFFEDQPEGYYTKRYVRDWIRDSGCAVVDIHASGPVIDRFFKSGYLVRRKVAYGNAYEYKRKRRRTSV